MNKVSKFKLTSILTKMFYRIGYFVDKIMTVLQSKKKSNKMRKVSIDQFLTFRSYIERFNSSINNAYQDLKSIESKNETHRHYLMFLERYMWGWKDIYSLISFENGKINSVFSAPLIARALIVDSITVVHLDSKLKEGVSSDKIDDADFLKICMNLDTDFLKAFINSMGKIFKKADDNEFDKKAFAIKNAHPEHFTSNPNIVEFRKGYESLTTTAKIDSLISELNRIELVKDANYVEGPNIFSPLKYLFKYYSQFEHVSPYTREYLYDANKENFTNIVGALFYSILSSWLILFRLNYQSEYSIVIDKLKKEIQTYIMELEN